LRATFTVSRGRRFESDRGASGSGRSSRKTAALSAVNFAWSSSSTTLVIGPTKNGIGVVAALELDDLVE
jgi:hypothetical protein